MFEKLKELSRCIISFFLLACLANLNIGQATHKQINLPKVLVVYFSHTGNSDLVAKKIAKELNTCSSVTLTRICPESKEHYPAYGDELRNIAQKEAQDDNCLPKFVLEQDKECLKNLNVRNYQTITIVTPVWWLRLPKILLHFLKTQNWNGKDINLIVTHAGDSGSCKREVVETCKGAHLIQYFELFCSSPGDGNIDEDKVSQFIECLKKDLSMSVPVIELNNGTQIPQLGIGTYRLAEGEETYQAVLTALQCGYRHIDTAHAYGNERSVGKAIKDSGLNRKEIWVTSKLWPNEFGKGKTLQAIDKMLSRLGVEYIDLLYLHQPVGDYIGAWKDMEQALAVGKVKALGFCNFDVTDDLFDNFLNHVAVKPQIMQIECHPYAQRKHWQDLARKNNIKVECWFPLGGRESGGLLLKDPILVEMARRYNKSVAQIILRWHIQKGFIVVPGSSNPDHIKDNINIFDFQLTDEDMEKIENLNREDRVFKVTLAEKQDKYSKIILED